MGSHEAVSTGLRDPGMITAHVLHKYIASNDERPVWRILIPDGDSPFALQVAQCLKRGNPALRIDAAYVDRRALARFSRYVDRTIALDPKAPLEGLESLLGKTHYDLLLPVSGPGIDFVAVNLARLGPLTRVAATPTHDQLTTVNDKWAFFQTLQRAGIPTPFTVLVDSTGCADAFDPQEPVILKPRGGSGGLGIVKLNSAREFAARAGEFLGEGHPYIMQRYLEGRDIDRSVLCANGTVLASAVQQSVERHHGFAPSSALHFHSDGPVEALVDRMMAALNWNGIAHIDLRYGQGQATPVVIEVNPRYWATLLGSLVAGVNFPWVHVQAAMGRPVEPTTLRECHYVGFKEWPSYYLKQRTPLSETSLIFNLADPLAKLMKRWRPSTAMGGVRA